MKTRAPFFGLVAAIATFASHAGAVDFGELRRAHQDILRLDVADAHRALAGLSDAEPEVAREMAELAIYEGRCDDAVSLLERRALQDDEMAASLAEIARGCARVTAATTTIRDDARGIEVRLKDDDDAGIVPELMNVADAALQTLERDLGTALPRPLRIEVVKDHFSLAAMTGLPEEAAQTTGTVAVAKWGRVTMLSPRAAPHGYPWADTLMHELTHLTVTRASSDRAPLWLQEGVAKREEIRWRAPWPFDDKPSADAIAKRGFERGIALPLDKLGPSIAMLPSAEQAMVAFAEVTSFVRFWIKEQGEDALPRLFAGLADAPPEDAVNATLLKVSGANLVEWNDRWRKYLATVPTESADAVLPKKGEHRDTKLRDMLRDARLGELLSQRSHDAEAVPYLERAEELMPRDASVRSHLAIALRGAGHEEESAKLVSSLADIEFPNGVYLALRGGVLRERGENAEAAQSFLDALHLAPYEPEVACEAMIAPALPVDATRAALCNAARNARRR